MNPARFSSLLSYIVLIAFASMAHGGLVASSTRAAPAARAPRAGEDRAPAVHADDEQSDVRVLAAWAYRAQPAEAPRASDLDAVEPQDSEDPDPELRAAQRAHAVARFALGSATCSLQSKPRHDDARAYTPRFLLAPGLATGPPSILA